MTIQQNGNIDTKQYYDLRTELKEKKVYKNFEEAKDHLRKLMFDSVEKRMISDVPLGSFLSGGIDSSIVTAIMATFSKEPVKTFSIGFIEKEYDESERAKLLAKHIGSNHTVHYLDYKDVVHLVDDIILHFDEPFGDSSAIPSFFVAQLARKDVKVVLTGDCADELFGGYEKYLAGYYTNKYKKLPSFLRTIIHNTTHIIPHSRWTNSLLRRVKKVITNAEAEDFDLHYQYMCLGFSDKERSTLLGENNYREVKNIVRQKYNAYADGNALGKGFYTDLNVVLEGDMLVKVDRMCMKNSLEARVPFLDSEIVKAAYSMPVDFKIKGRNKKFILKKTFQDLLPASTLKYRKKGFGVPVDYWFNHELKEELDNLLNAEKLKKQGLFDVMYVQKIVQEHRSGKANHKGKLWNLFVFQKWYETKMI